MYYYLPKESFEELKKSPKDGGYYGSLYLNSLCVDIVTRQYDSDSDMDVDLDFYLLGIDDGYGVLDDGTPYSSYDFCGVTICRLQKESEIDFIKRCEDSILTAIHEDSKLQKYMENTKLKWIFHDNKEKLDSLKCYDRECVKMEDKISENKIKSFCIGEENGSIILTEDMDDFFEYLKDKITEAEERGQEHFDVTIERTEC